MSDDPQYDVLVAPKIPKTIGECADRYYSLRADLLRANKVVKAIEKEISELRDHIINELPKSSQTGASGRIANVRVVLKDKPIVKDWSALYEYIKQHDAFELLQKRLGEAAYNERVDQGETVPGVELFPVIEISCTKV